MTSCILNRPWLIQYKFHKYEYCELSICIFLRNSMSNIENLSWSQGCLRSTICYWLQLLTCNFPFYTQCWDKQHTKFPCACCKTLCLTLITRSAAPVTNHSLPGSTAIHRTQPRWPLITYRHIHLKAECLTNYL